MSRRDLARKVPPTDADPKELLQRTLDVVRREGRQSRPDPVAPRDAPRGLSERSLKTECPWSTPSLIPNDVRPLVVDKVARRQLDQLILHRDVTDEVSEFLSEFRRSSLLRSHSLEPRHKLLLLGPPGNGKTSLAEAIAYEAGLPFLTVRYDAMMDSMLGETAARLRRLMDFAAACPCLLFFDEFDAVGKERGDAQDVGEMKRVVGSLLVQLDAIPSHTIVVCATNHPELLDRAVWRRFDVRLAINPPGRGELSEWFLRLQRSLGVDLGDARHAFVDQLLGLSFSEVEALTLDVRRKVVLSEGKLSSEQALHDTMAKWSRRLAFEKFNAQDATIPNRQAAKVPSHGNRKTREAKADISAGPRD